MRRDLSLAVILAAACGFLCAMCGFLIAIATAHAQETAPLVLEPAASWWSTAGAWLVTLPGRVATAGVVYLAVALLKLLPLKGATPRAKQAFAGLLAAAAGFATAFLAGSDAWTALGGAGAILTMAIGAHELVSRIVGAALPLVVAIPRVGPVVALVLRAFLAPSSPSVEQLQADAELRRAAGGAE